MDADYPTKWVIIACRFTSKGLSHKVLAGMIRNDFQESLFWDFEDFDDNDIDGWLVGDFKRYCAALEIRPEEFADIPVSDLANLPLPALVKERREQKKLSIEVIVGTLIVGTLFLKKL